MRAIPSAWSPPLSLLSQSSFFVQLYVWMCIMFWKTSSENHCFWLKPITHCTFTERILRSTVCLNCIMFWKTSSESHCFCLKPTTHWTFTERILCSIVCLNVCNVLNNFFWKPLLLLEAHHSLEFHRAPTLLNCMFECVWCFEKLLPKAIASDWSPSLSVLCQGAFFVQLYFWMCIMFW